MRATGALRTITSIFLATAAMPALADPVSADTPVAVDAADTAADQEGQVRNNDDIVVNGARERRTGQAGAKTDTPLIALPQTVSVIDQEELVRRNALSINQALGYVAGISPNQRGNVATRYDQLYIRGFTPGIFMDGMRLLGGVYANGQVDFHLIDRVDVIKGPASVLYGNSTPGGLVNLTSKVPYRDAGGRIELAAGNFDLLRTSIDLNTPIDRDGKLLFRVIGGAERQDGFLRQTRNRRYYVRPMLTFAPDEATSITLILNYQRDPEAASYSGVPVYGSALPNPFGRLPVDLNVSEPGYEAFDRTQYSATLMFSHKLNDALTWTTNARYFDVDLHYRQIYLSFNANTNLDATGSTNLARITRGGGGADEKFHTITLDNRIAAEFATGPIRHTLLAGLDWQSNQGNNTQAFVLGTNANPAISVSNLDLYNPVYGNYTLTSNLLAFPNASLTRNFRKIDQVGAYLQDQIRIGRLNIIASGRHDWYEQVTVNRKLAAGAANAVSRLEQTKFTGRVGALYESGIGLSPFVSYSTSFEPQTGSTFNGTPFIPVTGRQYEAGLKFQPRGGSALFTFSAFDLKRQNVPVADPVNVGFSAQVGEVRVRGLELDGRGDIAPGLSLTVAATYTDPLTTRGNPAVGTGDQLAGVTGTRPLGIPKYSGSTFIAYDLSKAAGGAIGGFNVGAGVRYVGESDGTAQITRNRVLVTQRFKAPDFTLVDAVLGYDFGALDEQMKGMSVALNVQNLLNKRHIASCFFNNSCYFGASRTVVGTLRYAF